MIGIIISAAQKAGRKAMRHLACSALFAVAAITLAAIGVTGLANPAAAALRIEITQGNLDPLPIALPAFAGQQPESSEIGRDIAGVISANLDRSGLFRPISSAAFIQRDASAEAPPRFADWRAIDAQTLVVGNVDIREDGRLEVTYRLWDVLAGQQMTGQRFNTAPGNWRRIAHIISDRIYQRLTGESGYFDSRVVFVAESGPKKNRVKRLAIMDQDGANHRYLTDGSYLVLTPRFSPNRQEITYLSYFNDRPRVYLYNIDTNRQEVLGDFPGMTFAPRFSPDGNTVIMSMARDGNSDLYAMDLRTRQIERLTDHPAIDTSASYAPNGDRIVFNSDRGGSQQIYVMNADGSDVERISFGEGRYATPVWSPRGDLIAFTKIYRGQFYIGVMRPDGSGERILSGSYLDEAPTWSPNGRVLMFFRQDPGRGSAAGRTRLWSVDLTGYNEREIKTPMDASDPAWSPLSSLKE